MFLRMCLGFIGFIKGWFVLKVYLGLVEGLLKAK